MLALTRPRDTIVTKMETIFLEKNQHISASPEMRWNAEISIASNSSYPVGANLNRRSSGKVFFAGLLYNLQATTNYYYYCLIAPPLYLTYLILSRT